MRKPHPNHRGPAVEPRTPKSCRAILPFVGRSPAKDRFVRKPHPNHRGSSIEIRSPEIVRRDPEARGFVREVCSVANVPARFPLGGDANLVDLSLLGWDNARTGLWLAFAHQSPDRAVRHEWRLCIGMEIG